MEITQQHKELITSIKEVLYPWRKFSIAIDGSDGSGKSTLSRFIAWQLGMPVIETDMLIIKATKPIQYKLEIIKLLIDSRHLINRPVIVEGVSILYTLEKLQITPDFHIFVKNLTDSGSSSLEKEILEYKVTYSPEEKANYVFTWSE